MLGMSNLAAKVRERITLLEIKAGSRAALAKAANVSEGGLRDFMKSRHDNLGIDLLQKLADAAGVPPDYFFTDDINLGDTARPSREAAVVARVLNAEYANIPVYDITASAGPGAINDPHGEPLYQHPFSESWLRALTRAPRASLAIIRVSGDSMQDTLFNGDHVLVDRSIRQVGRDGIYVIRLSDWDELRVKRCERRAKTKLLTIKSDNPRYDPEEDVRDEDIAVEGRVIWLGRNIGG